MANTGESNDCRVKTMIARFTLVNDTDDATIRASLRKGVRDGQGAAGGSPKS